MKFSNPNSLPASLREQIYYRDLAQGERVFRRGDTARYIYILATGRIWLVRPTIENKRATLQFAKPGDIIGENALFENFYLSSAIANVASRVIVYHRSCIPQIIENYPDLVEDLLQKLTQKISYYQTNVELREIRAAHQRVLQYLRYIAESRYWMRSLLNKRISIFKVKNPRNRLIIDFTICKSEAIVTQSIFGASLRQDTNLRELPRNSRHLGRHTSVQLFLTVGENLYYLEPNLFSQLSPSLDNHCYLIEVLPRLKMIQFPVFWQ